jgi:hypothetical protein
MSNMALSPRHSKSAVAPSPCSTPNLAQAKAALARDLLDFLLRARHDPSLRFEALSDVAAGGAVSRANGASSVEMRPSYR